MKTSINTQYRVAYEGLNGWYSPDGYSKYHERWKQSQEKNTMPWDVYGYEQALDHIKELKEDIYEGKKHNANKKFFIEIITTVTTKVPITD